MDGMSFNGEGAGRRLLLQSRRCPGSEPASSAARSAEHEIGSVQANLIPKEGGNTVRRVFFTQLHQRGPDERQPERRNSGPWPELGQHDRAGIYEFNGAIGGPIVAGQALVLHRHRVWGFKNPVAGNYLQLDTGNDCSTHQT